MTFYLKKIVTGFLLPPTSLFILIAVGLFLVSFTNRRRAGLVLGWAGALALLSLSMPLVAFYLTCLVSDARVITPDRMQLAQAIVILGGGLRRNAIEFGTDVPNGLTMERIRYGAVLARRTHLPVLVTGGRVFGVGRAEADVMREVLERDFQVPVRWVEVASRNTHENAQYSAKMLRQAHVERVVLVTHAVDSRRARREFEATGLHVTVAPTMIPRHGEDSWIQHVPSVVALQGSALAIYELAANLALTLGLSGG
ncbi:MAG TPA: YdcF family protein [Burkholderiales bacterium]|nr:YdcF family protein [Burkholderiales bacterium]